MFGIFCTAMGFFAAVFVKETKGRSLEDMDLIFGAVDEAQRRADVENTMHKNDVVHEENVESQSEKPAEQQTGGR